MTKIKLHGIIAKEFVESFELNVSSAKEVFDAIDANNPKFKKRILELSKQGMNFTILVDGKRLECTKELNIKRKYKRIDIVPAIMGKGPISTVVAWVANAALLLLTLAVVYGVYLLIDSLMNKPDAPDISQTVGAFEESYAFSNKANIVKQGFPVPVGYGRLYVGSNVIRSVEKNYPQNREPLDFFSVGDGVASKSRSTSIIAPEFPDETPPDYRAWIGNISASDTVPINYDPDSSHAGFAGLFWKSPTDFFGQGGTVEFSVGNEGNQPVKYARFTLLKPWVDFNTNPVPSASFTVQPGDVAQGYLANIGGPIIGWGQPNSNRFPKSTPYNSYGSKFSFTGFAYWVIVVYTGSSIDWIDETNIITKSIVTLRCTYAGATWDSYAPRAEGSINPVYPNGDCEGYKCSQNTSNIAPSQGCLGGAAPDAWFPCPPNGPGTVTQFSTAGGGIGPRIIQV